MKQLLLAALLAAQPLAAQEIALNQLGFQPGSPKLALLSGAGSQPVPWTLTDASGATVLSGRSTPYGQDAASGQQLQRIAFDSLAGPGEGYRLHAAGVSSDPFRIDAALYRPLAVASLAYFYHNRAGVPIEARFAGGERWARPAGHPHEVATCFAGKDQKGNVWSGCPYRLDVSGGWYDAGDPGKYVVNGGISLWTLLNLYERLPQAFADRSLPLPEAGNGVSDLLDHARWEMDFLLRMQVPEGQKLRLPVAQAGNAKPLVFTEVDAGGMAHHKLAGRQWAAMPGRPDADTGERLLYPPGTAATLNLAATAAQCARIWRQIDPAFSARCLQAAERAWKAALRHPDIHAVGDFAGSGGYGDADFSDEFYWAAAELYTTTGGAPYGQALRALPHFARIDSEPGWPATAPLGTLTLAFAQTGLRPEETQKLRAAIRAAADAFLAERDKVGYAIPFSTRDYPWGSNSNLLNRAMLLAAAYDLSGDTRYRTGVVDVMDYLLGRNPLGISYVSGFGERAMQRPHHRFWAESLDPAYPPPPPGALSGGPNSSAMADPVAGAMQGRCAPQACWADDAHAYALNEVAINWNAPLAWVATWLDARR